MRGGADDSFRLFYREVQLWFSFVLFLAPITVSRARYLVSVIKIFLTFLEPLDSRKLEKSRSLIDVRILFEILRRSPFFYAAFLGSVNAMKNPRGESVTSSIERY